MNWLTRMFTRDPAQSKRIAEAETQRDDAVEHLREARELNERLRPAVARNHFTERVAAVYARREGHA